MRVAAIDCGTNTIRLLIARTAGPDDPPGAALVELHRGMAYVRLGQGVDATGEFHADALQRTFAATEDFARLITEHQVEAVRFVATSAARDVRNRDEFLDGVEARLGQRPEVVSGHEEAELSYTGAVSGLDTDLSDPVLVMDIGGGSTELVLGHGGVIIASVSLDVGSVRLTERMFTGDPVPPEQWRAAAALVDGMLDDAARATEAVDLTGVASWVGVAGTVTTMAAIAHGLDRYDRTVVHGSRLSSGGVTELSEWFGSSTAAQRAVIPTLPPRRADVIAAGSLIAARIAARMSTDLVVSESDILDGIAMRLAATNAR